MIANSFRMYTINDTKREKNYERIFFLNNGYHLTLKRQYGNHFAYICKDGTWINSILPCFKTPLLAVKHAIKIHRIGDTSHIGKV